MAQVKHSKTCPVCRTEFDVRYDEAPWRDKDYTFTTLAYRCARCAEDERNDKPEQEDDDGRQE